MLERLLGKDRAEPLQGHRRNWYPTQRFLQAEKDGIKTGWITDYKQCSYQGLTETEVSTFIKDLHRMVPDPFRKYVDWELTKTEQGTWPTKTMVNMWFSNETKVWSGCWTSSKRNSRRSNTSCVGKNLIQIGDEPEKEAFGEGPMLCSMKASRW